MTRTQKCFLALVLGAWAAVLRHQPVEVPVYVLENRCGPGYCLSALASATPNAFTHWCPPGRRFECARVAYYDRISGKGIEGTVSLLNLKDNWAGISWDKGTTEALVPKRGLATPGPYYTDHDSAVPQGGTD